MPTGIRGLVLAGVFATSVVNGSFTDSAGKKMALGLVDGHAAQIGNQLIGCAIAWGLAIAGSLVILKICDMLVGLRVAKEQEIQGLDVSMHGEEGYLFES